MMDGSLVERIFSEMPECAATDYLTLHR